MSAFTRREFVALGSAAAVSACAPLSSSPEASGAAGTAPDSLNALARAKGLRFGSCLGTGPSGAPQSKSFDGKRASSFEDENVRAIAIRECGMMVPENELKWYTLRPDADTFDFSRADRLIAFAETNHMAVRGHTLLWHLNQWFPPWVLSHDFGANPSAAAEKLLRDHISTVCGRYGTRVFAWDVVNETIDPATGDVRDTVFTRYLGNRVIDIAFEAAHQAAPHAQLVYNDYMSWAPGNEKHRTGVLKLLERLRNNNVPVAALGVQSHIGTDNTDTAAGFARVQDKEWRGFLDEVTGMGLDLAITEFDVHDKGLPADIAVRDRAVGDFGRAYLDLMLSYPQLRYVMGWGLVDRYSWLQDRWPRDDGLPKRPNPYDDDYNPKPLRAAIAAALRSASPRTDLLG